VSVELPWCAVWNGPVQSGYYSSVQWRTAVDYVN